MDNAAQEGFLTVLVLCETLFIRHYQSAYT